MTETVPVLALDVAPLAERHHTGIANVTKNLARHLLDDTSVDARFFTGRAAISRDIVEQLIALDSGHILNWISTRVDFGRPDFGALDRPIVGIFCHHKRHRRLFPVEVLLVHDLTTVLTPQFHTAGSVLFGAQQVLGDMLTSELLVPVSRSTEADIRTYFPQVDTIPSIVMPLAPTTMAADEAAGEAFPDEVAPFIVVLGTLEPRKNVQFVFEYLAANRELMSSYTFVFVGRWGWGRSADDLIAACGLTECVEAGTIQLTGFVSDDVRDALLRNAACVVYVSKYEGFGLPVLEALAAGTAVVTGYGTSLPEAGGPVAIYCDVTSAAAFGVALREALSPISPSSAQQRREWVTGFSWEKSYRLLRDASLAVARGQTYDTVDAF